jgi:hypothetical protein
MRPAALLVQRAPHHLVEPERPDQPREPGASLPPPSPSGARGGVGDSSPARRPIPRDSAAEEGRRSQPEQLIQRPSMQNPEFVARPFLPRPRLRPAADPIGDVIVGADLEVDRHIAREGRRFWKLVADAVRQRLGVNRHSAGRRFDLPEGRHAEAIPHGVDLGSGEVRSGVVAPVTVVDSTWLG